MSSVKGGRLVKDITKSFTYDIFSHIFVCKRNILLQNAWQFNEMFQFSMSLSTSILKVSSYLYKTCAPGWLGFISHVLYYTLCWTLGEGDSACSVLGITYSIRIDGKHGLCLGQTRGVVNLAYPGLSAPFSQI